jgi:hypothetical protein
MLFPLVFFPDFFYLTLILTTVDALPVTLRMMEAMPVFTSGTSEVITGHCLW